MKYIITTFIALISSVSACADPGIEYKTDGKNGFIPTAIVGMQEVWANPGSGCSQRIADIVVDEIVYDGASDIVKGFRAEKPASKNSKEWYGIFLIDSDLYEALPRVRHGDVLKVIRKGESLIVVYQICGSGGIVYVRDVFKKSAINNP